MSGWYSALAEWLIDWLTRESKPQEAPPCDFNRLKYEVRPGDVLLIEGRSRISRVIRSITQSSWTHAALYIGKLHDLEDQELRTLAQQHLKTDDHLRLVIEGILGQGIIVSPLSTYREHHVRICRPIGLTPYDAEKVIAYAIRALGGHYSIRQFLDLARFILPWSILPRRWGSSLFKTSEGEVEKGICSSLIAEAFTSVQFPILPFLTLDDTTQSLELIHRNPHLFTPKDFDHSPYFEIIKYPIFDPKDPLPYYRRLPWKEDALHQGNGIVSIGRMGFQTHQNFTKKSEPSGDLNRDYPETD